MKSSKVERNWGRSFGVNASTKSVLMALAIGIGASLYGGQALAATLTVGTCQGSSPYVTIQEAVNAANAGDTVQVCPGTYAESVFIETNLTLIGIETRRRGGPVTLPTIIYPSSVDRLCLDGSQCPQIFVKNSSVHIADLEVDGSNFKFDACTHNPIGILFLDSGGTVAGSISANHDSLCELGPEDTGDGIDVRYTQMGTFSVDISNNHVSGFANVGIGVVGAIGDDPGFTPINFTGAISNNTVTTTLKNPNDSPVGIGVDYSQAFTVSGNTISLPALIDGNAPGFEGIYAANSQQLSMGQNSVTNYTNAIQMYAIDSSNIDANTISNSYYGVQLDCSSNNTVALNQIKGQLPGGSVAGVTFSVSCGGQPDQPSDDNNIIVNAIDGYCAGILNMNLPDTGNNYEFDAFSNDSVDIMLVPSAPCF
jgi:nitrous oxidase accessory protein NosD